MGFRFQKRITIAPGIRLNLSKSGFSTTVGKQGASVNFGKNGSFLNMGIPGTGLSHRSTISSSSSGSAEPSQAHDQEKPDVPGTHWSNCFVLFSLTLFGFVFFAPAIYLFYKAWKRYSAKTKPIYGAENSYTSDKRYKTGQRVSGQKRVIIGMEPMTEAEIAVSKKMALARLIAGLVFTAVIAYAIIAVVNSPEFNQ